MANDFESFKAKLSNGGYNSMGGVNKALGRMKELSEADKEKAVALATKHFGAADKPAAKAAGPGPGRGRKAKAEKKASGARRGRPPKAKTEVSAEGSGEAKRRPGRPKKVKTEDDAVQVTEKRRPGRPPKAGKKSAAAPRAAKAAAVSSDLAPVHEMIAQLEPYRMLITSYEEAVNSLKKCEGPGIDVSAGLKKLSVVITKAIEDMTQSFVPYTAQLASPPAPTPQEQRGAQLFAQVAPPHVPTNTGAAVQPPVIPPTMR